eukprot:CAMPEP_0168740634 /NCGR_PEP_ID=MMETSP0724-20121128/12089_1 /TAXON_ID=265536 /ORGANISM="Amphiprora sp., Strain CCMP467" /LENGTH=250 /DNA_ID=CAMNT_0008788093 /DNA_START=23 /DNA_END=776 /DNA_ORIENTATION=+
MTSSGRATNTIDWPEPSTFSRIVRWHVWIDHPSKLVHEKHILLVPAEYGVYYTLLYLWNQRLAKFYDGKPSPFDDYDDDDGTKQDEKALVWWCHYTQTENSNKAHEWGGDFHNPQQTKPTKDGKSKVLNKDNIALFDQGAFEYPLRKEFTSWTRLTTTFTLYCSTHLAALSRLNKCSKHDVLTNKDLTIRCTCYDRHKSNLPNTVDCAYLEGDDGASLLATESDETPIHNWQGTPIMWAAVVACCNSHNY